MSNALTIAPVPATVEPSIILKKRSSLKVFAVVYKKLAMAKPSNPKMMNIFLPYRSAQETMIGDKIKLVNEKTPINSPN